VPSQSRYYLDDVESIMRDLGTQPTGLTQQEANYRLTQNGKNELRRAKKKSLALRFLEQFKNVMVYMLLAAAAFSVIQALFNKSDSSESLTGAAVILFILIFNAVMSVVQEGKADKSTEALQKMSAATTKVRRGGTVAVIPTSELTIGDIVLLEAGDAVPADLRLSQCINLRIEESSLTGESIPVDKKSDTLHGNQSNLISLGDRKNMAYMGTGVVYGRGEGVVVAIGMGTEMGKIATSIESIEQEKTPLQNRLDQLSKILGIAVTVISAVVFVAYMIQADRITLGVVLDSFMVAVALAVAAIPEGMVMVVSIVLAIGTNRMAKKNAIVRRLPSVETLGCTQVICTDKTGTLTMNKMTVTEWYGDEHLLADSMFFCNDVKTDAEGKFIGDPTQLAQKEFGKQHGLGHDNPRLNEELPFDSIRKMMTTLHDDPRVGDIIQYTTGAPDEVLKKCSSILVDGKIEPLTEERLSEVLGQNKRMADKALRVLGGALRRYKVLPENITPETIECEMTFVGLVGMIDPVRPEVKGAIEQCKRAGIKVVMITGDHISTAVAIAKEIDIIDSPDQAITGNELNLLSDTEFEERLESLRVYARVQPEHKLRIVNTWKKKGFVTAMTGDGVNDAPAIKAGDIGIGMGITGTDVTKNVADMVLSDDNFATIVAAVEEGRRIEDNNKKVNQFLLSTNLSEVISVFVASLMNFILFKPVHLLFINLITDSLPAVALGTEHPEKDIMRRPPRKKNEGVFAGGLGTNIIYQGIYIALITLAAYLIVDIWDGHTVAMTAAFFTLSICEIFQAFTMRSIKQSIFGLKTQNKILWGTLAGSLALALLVIYVPPLASIFSLEALSFKEVIVSLGLAASVIPVIEITKFFQLKLAKT